MREFGVPEEGILVEKMSGKDFNRPVYQSLMKKIKSGDIFVVKSIDRLGRDYSDIIEQWRVITMEMNADIVVIDMPILDTRKKDRDLTAALVSHIVLQLLSYASEIERSFMLQRQAEGIAAAKAKGIQLGRKPKERTALFYELREKWLNGKISSREAGRQLNISHTAFLSWIDEETRGDNM